jgi:GNAT superfamily N-acetyltransferase
LTVSIRLAGADDADVALAIDPTAATSPHRADWLRRAFAGEHGRVARIAYLDDQPAGFAVVGWFFSNPFLDLIVTDARLQRRGVASALLDEIEREHAARKLFVSTNVSNAVMRALLPARGYLPAGQVDHLDPGDPELFFVRLPR